MEEEDSHNQECKRIRLSSPSSNNDFSQIIFWKLDCLKQILTDTNKIFGKFIV